MNKPIFQLALTLSNDGHAPSIQITNEYDRGFAECKAAFESQIQKMDYTLNRLKNECYMIRQLTNRLMYELQKVDISSVRNLLEEFRINESAPLHW